MADKSHVVQIFIPVSFPANTPRTQKQRTYDAQRTLQIIY
jgi:hypothetical protein